MRESSIEKHLVKEVKRLGGWAIKIYCYSFAGLPDRLVLLPKGRLFFVELKAPTKKPSKLQIVVHKRLQKLGFSVWVLDSKHDVNNFIDYVEN